MTFLSRRVLPLAAALSVILLFGGCEHGQRALMPVVENLNSDGVYRIPPQTDDMADVVYLTIDDGPSDLTGELLDILAAHNATATLFLHTDHIKGTAVLRRALSEGHNLAHHMPADRDWTEVPAETFQREFLKSHCELSAFGEGYAAYFRPPRAAFDPETMLPVLREAGFDAATPLMMASYVPWDASGVTEWRWRAGSRALAKRYAWGLGIAAQPGDIVLFHDGPRLRRTAQSMVSLEIFLNHLDERGLRAVALPSLPADDSMCRPVEGR